MDLSQTDHLKAYGIAYHALQYGFNVEWLLNYRGGSFLMDYSPRIEKECAFEGVRMDIIEPSRILEIYQTIENNNMESI
ncbi:MAG: asparagine synthetase B, partial [candidate division WOR-3 bacterium]